MKRSVKSVRMLLVLASLCMVLLLAAPVWAADAARIEDAMEDIGGYLYETVQKPQVGSTGGEWAVIGLARSGYDVPQSYYDDYYNAVVDHVREHNGVLHSRKYTEYSRVIVALSAIGRDARDVGGYDLTRPLGDYDKTIWQGINGPVWALIALDSADYPMPQNTEATTQATRQMYIDLILDSQLPDGGWSLNSVGEARQGDTGDPDVTGMVLQALANYQEQPAVKAAINKALACLSEQQDSNGGFGTMGIETVESCAQVIVALCALDVPLDDARFVKEGNSLLDSLLSYHLAGQGMIHTKDNAKTDPMATEQGYYALTAAWRAANGMTALYDMGDVKMAEQTAEPGAAVDIQKTEVANEGVTFGDISGDNAHPNKQAIEGLAARGIITGDTAADGSMVFRPDDTMTRAEFAAIVVRALGLEPVAKNVFSDIKPAAWYAAYIDTANACGIVKGTSATTFEPNSQITRQDAAVMVARAAVLCGMENKVDDAAAAKILAGFADNAGVADYAAASVAFCYEEGIMDISGEIKPGQAILRCEIAQMLFNLLGEAELL